MKKIYKTLSVIFLVTMFFSLGCKDSTDPIAPNGNTGSSTVTLFGKVWSGVNLSVDHYRNGDPIPQVKDSAQWANLKTGAWCFYKGESSYDNTYGKLYNWYAVKDPRGLAPTGWHIPDTTEWAQLFDSLGGYAIAGGKLKATTYWDSPNTGATNSSGFTAFPAGIRFGFGYFDYIGKVNYFWSSMPTDTTATSVQAYSFLLYFNNAAVEKNSNNNINGLSVRCVKDTLN